MHNVAFTYCISWSKSNQLKLTNRSPYSQISDDEDDTHPNIDTPSLFRWRHQARVERMGEFEKKKSETKESLER